jgi:DNA-binding PadR family transcriptional regulator
MEQDGLDSISRNVLVFLTSKGLLRGREEVRGRRAVKLTVKDFLHTAETVEPRVLAVLPAALIHFPRAFLDRETLPQQIKIIIQAIADDLDDGPDLFHVSYGELKRWANSKLKDKRTKPAKERKTRKTYRFSPDVVAKVEKVSTQKKVTETALLEKLVREYL